MFSLRNTIILSLALSLLDLVSGQSMCPLCASFAETPTRWTYTFSDGRTCTDIYMELSTVLASDDYCQEQKDIAQAICCGDADVPTPAPVYSGGTGSEPECPICGTDEYPGIPNSYLVIRYVGSYTCGQLYERGLHGLIPEFMCGPVQDYAYSICGCGQYNPACIEDPTQCYGYSGPSPTAPTGPSPTTPTGPSPTNAPTAAPVDTSFSNRKTPPEGGKYSTKLSDGRGGSGGTRRLRGE
eukprot:Nitzschia sp. Nitz4//scaffold68_size99682//14636//15486//NITZ4_004553-RA/size99682-snap-gene-0.0-mRNA-1//1//CDS//3329556560//5147//frame0